MCIFSNFKTNRKLICVADGQELQRRNVSFVPLQPHLNFVSALNQVQLLSSAKMGHR